MCTPRRARGAGPVAILIAVAVLTGCTSDEDTNDPDGTDAPVVQLGAPGEENTTLSPEDAEAIEGPGYTDADVAFVQGMIPHHRQALEMTALIETRNLGASSLPVMAERIEVSQTDEIGQLERWLIDRGEDLPGEHGHHGDHHDLMPGMLTVAELDQLSAARGTRFDRLFLQYMIRHHEGAVLMVEQLLASGGGQESQAFQLAQHIASDQRVEIARMKRMLVRLST